MGVIKRLSEDLANKIAAGEVVQRPASVVKELVENALDAGATEIGVVVRNAGKNLILVSDNGSGMSSEDARLAFERHATSKISQEDDLFAINTLGFRGEALAAIAAVAQVELKTRQEGEDLGTLLKVENGKILEETRTACDKGTMISVRNLFFSVPARRKFLKSDATEFRHISETMQAVALSNPDVTFAFSDEPDLVFSVQGGTLEERVAALWDQGMVNALLPFELDREHFQVHGYIGRPNFARKTKTDQFLFLNGRPITSRLLSHGIYSGYEHLLDKQSYPPYILFIKVDPDRVDVNVHPQKAEVKFDDEQEIYRALQQGVSRTLSEYDLVPGMNLGSSETGDSLAAALSYAMPTYDRAEQRERSRPESGDQTPGPGPRPFRDAPYEREPRPGNGREDAERFAQLFLDPFSDRRESGEGGAEAWRSQEVSYAQKVRPIDEDEERTRLWQIHNKYIISQIRSGIMIVDQHVAHERIMYELALKSFEQSMPMSQQLLFPQRLKLSTSEAGIVRQLRTELGSLGFDLGMEKDGTIVIEGVPQDVRSGQEESIFRELIDQYLEYQEMGKTDSREMLAASFACRASIKAGDPLSEEEMRTLIDQLFATTMPYVCPHGRPIVIRIDLGELDRRFGRTS